MESFIRELYFGNIDPQARRFEADSQYGKSMKKNHQRKRGTSHKAFKRQGTAIIS